MWDEEIFQELVDKADSYNIANFPEILSAMQNLAKVKDYEKAHAIGDLLMARLVLFLGDWNRVVEEDYYKTLQKIVEAYESNTKDKWWHA